MQATMYTQTITRSRSFSPPRSRSRPTSRRDHNPPTKIPEDHAPLRAHHILPTSSRHVRNSGHKGSGRRSRAYPADAYNEDLHHDRYHNHNDHNNSTSPPPAPHRRKREVTMYITLFHSTSHTWSVVPFTFRPDKTTDKQLWEEIRETFRRDLQNPFKRVFGFNRVMNIVPIACKEGMAPTRTDPKDFPESRQWVHAYHHPEMIRADRHRWVDWLTTFDTEDTTRHNGLEFVEGLWAEKLAAVAIVATVAIVIVCIVWCVRGGVLQTVFTVMGFVLSFVAAEIALVALYYQMASTGSGS